MTYRDLCMAIRVALTGSTVGFGLFDVMEILGPDECVRRIKSFIEEAGK